MEIESSSLLVQNVIGRITHGLIGLDLYLQEKKKNNYLNDFLTVTENEVKEALLLSTSKLELIPAARNELLNKQIELINIIKETQNMVKNLDKIDPDKDVVPLIQRLGSKLNIIYEKAIP